MQNLQLLANSNLILSIVHHLHNYELQQFTQTYHMTGPISRAGLFRTRCTAWYFNSMLYPDHTLAAVLAQHQSLQPLHICAWTVMAGASPMICWPTKK
jgi:hypothetical protein